MITKQQLRRLIKEEMSRQLNEQPSDADASPTKRAADAVYSSYKVLGADMDDDKNTNKPWSPTIEHVRWLLLNITELLSSIDSEEVRLSMGPRIISIAQDLSAALEASKDENFRWIP